jgi:hypothetical protein
LVAEGNRVKLHTFMTAPERYGAEFTGESWPVHREVLAKLGMAIRSRRC